MTGRSQSATAAVPRVDDRLYSVTAVAALLDRPVGTLYNWRSRGEGPPSCKIRGKVMYRESQLERWLEEQELATERGEGVAPTENKEAASTNHKRRRTRLGTVGDERTSRR